MFIMLLHVMPDHTTNINASYALFFSTSFIKIYGYPNTNKKYSRTPTCNFPLHINQSFTTHWHLFYLFLIVHVLPIGTDAVPCLIRMTNGASYGKCSQRGACSLLWAANVPIPDMRMTPHLCSEMCFMIALDLWAGSKVRHSRDNQ